MSEIHGKASFKAFIQLLREHKNIEAIDAFYSDAIEQYENNDGPIIGKEKLRTMEMENLTKVENMTMDIQREVYDVEKNIAWGQMTINYVQDQVHKRISEAFCQKWVEGRIVSQWFYYNGIETLEN